MKHFNLRKLAYGLATMVGLSGNALAYDGTGKITSGGILRTYALHAPGANLEKGLPVLFVLHGDGGTATSMTSAGFNAVADANNFLVVYPNALNTYWNTYVDDVPGNAGSGDENAPDDVQFFSDLIDDLCSEYNINAQKVYVTGMSAGGFMCYNLAIQLNNKIAAFAPVSANLWGDNGFIKDYFDNSAVPVPIYHIHGTKDNVVDYPDPDGLPGSWEEYPLNSFGYLSCGTDTYTGPTTLAPGVKKHSFCASPKEVSLIGITNLGHSWPNASGYNAAAAIWNFCNGYSLSNAPSCAPAMGIKVNDHADISVAPNPAAGFFTVNINGKIASVKLFDALGQEVTLTSQGSAVYSYAPGITQGVYTLKIATTNGSAYSRKLVLQ